MNTYFKYSVVTGICALLCAPATQAQDEEQESRWSGKAALGYLATSGNTDTSSLNTSFEVGYKTGNWQHGLDGSAINSSESNVKTAGAYEVGWKSARNLTEHDFLSGRINWREDQFGAYRTQLSETINYGRRIIDSDAQRLNVEVGLGGRQSELRTGIEEEELVNQRSSIRTSSLRPATRTRIWNL
jgi:putative salt-induced outer membrane protein